MLAANGLLGGHEGRCPACGEWSPVYWFGSLLPGGYWWQTPGCPKCGHISLVETECEIRAVDAAHAKEDAR